MGDKLKVLCVDDNREAASASARLLEIAGCEVRAVNDGRTALAVAREFRPDVCVLDLRMPGMSGEEVARQLQEELGENAPRCIALTGLWDIDAQHRTNNAGFDEHLVKPTDPDRLVEAVLGCKLADAAPGRS